MSTADRLPDFPWDTIAGAKATASLHPDGIVDLSVGTPVDPTPQLGREALSGASDASGYPTVWGTPGMRQAVIDYLVTRWGAITLPHEGIMPVVGTKELVAWLPTLLGLGPDDLVVYPTTAYPTYEVGAALARTQRLACDDPASIDGTPKLIWINSPANPHGAILDADATRAWITYAREVGAILASDECYGEFGWDAEPVSVLRADLCDARPDNLLSIGSLSKRSNVAGYRAGYVAGDPAVVMDLVAVRKHAGMMVPAPVQEAMRVLLGDQSHVEEQRGRYLARRLALRPALEAAGFRVDHSEGSLYLWVTRDEDCRATVDWFAERGILVAPGDFYGDAGRRHVRVALTATDERVAAAVTRLSAS